MELLRRAPLGELDSLERRLRRIFADAGVVTAPLPAADVYETDDSFVVELEVPGFAEGELDVETTDHGLVVKGHREEAKEVRERDFQLRERLESSFERRFAMPRDVDPAALKATFEKGVLTLKAAKTPSALARKVPITPTS